MADEEVKQETASEPETSTALTPAHAIVLKEEAQKILHQLITETDAEKQKDLTYLFLQNQNKRLMARMSKEGELADEIMSQLLVRFKEHSDEITTKEQIDALKVVSDLMSKGRAQLTSQEEQIQQPTVSINVQDNSVNVGDAKKNLGRESRNKVQNVIADVLRSIGVGDAQAAEEPEVIDQEEVIDATLEENEEDD